MSTVANTIKCYSIIAPWNSCFSSPRFKDFYSTNKEYPLINTSKLSAIKFVVDPVHGRMRLGHLSPWKITTFICFHRNKHKGDVKSLPPSQPWKVFSFPVLHGINNWIPKKAKLFIPWRTGKRCQRISSMKYMLIRCDTFLWAWTPLDQNFCIRL